MKQHNILQKYRKDEILKAARKVIAEKGWGKATIEEVAEKAGIAKGTVYIYFKNKDELFSSALLDVTDRVIDAIEKAVSKNGAVTKKLEAVVKTQLSFIEKEMNFLRVFLTERPMICIGSGDELNRLMYEKKERLIEIISSIIEKGIREGKFKKIEPRYAAYFLLDIIRGAIFYRIMKMHRERLASEYKTKTVPCISKTPSNNLQGVFNVSKEPTPYNLKSIIDFYIGSLRSWR